MSALSGKAFKNWFQVTRQVSYQRVPHNPHLWALQAEIITVKDENKAPNL